MKNSAFIEGMYEMAKSDSKTDPITGIPVFDEQKFRRELEKNDNLGKRNADLFRQGERKFSTCPRYNPCPICDKCQNKASHLYVACQTCKIPICAHTYSDRKHMIRRENFTVYVTEDIMQYIRAVDKALT